MSTRILSIDSRKTFIQYLAQKGNKQTYIDMSVELIDSFHNILKNNPLSSETIDMFVRRRWSGYVSRDKATYKILNDYAKCFEKEIPLFSNAFHEHVRETFEGEVKKAMNNYKATLVYIPKDTKIVSYILGDLTNAEFVETFKSLQELVYAIYDDIEHGSPFDWGYPDWKAITWEGLNHNRIMMLLDALVNSANLIDDMLVIEKKYFSKYNACKPIAKTKLTLNKLIDKGFIIEDLDNNRSSVFTVSYPNIQNLIKILYAYFKKRYTDCHNSSEECNSEFLCKNHVHVFSYRFVEDPATQNRESLFLAKTDGESTEIREIYYWLYDEAVRYGFNPKGYENMGCYVYKKDAKEWLLLGNGSSYHEDEFLHSVKYKIAAKCRFHRVFQMHPEKIDKLMKRFPDSFGRPWTQCFKCKSKADHCKNRVTFKKSNQEYYHCGTKFYLFFHNPTLDDVKAICELYKSENNIKEIR